MTRAHVVVEELREEIEDALECRADRQAERLRIEVQWSGRPVRSGSLARKTGSRWID